MPIPESDIEKVPADQFIPPDKGYEHGRWGYTPDDSPEDADTVAAVTRDLPGQSGTANVADKPSAAARARADKNYEPLKGSSGKHGDS